MMVVSVLRQVTTGLQSLTIAPVEYDETGEAGFEAYLDAANIRGYGVTAEGALIALAEQIEAAEAGGDDGL
jgi:hypothetical protein